MNYSLPADEVLPCLCLQVGAQPGTVGVAGLPPKQRGSGYCVPPSGILRGPAKSRSQHGYPKSFFFFSFSPTQVWLETQDPLRATLCPFSHGTRVVGLGWAGGPGCRRV